MQWAGLAVLLASVAMTFSGKLPLAGYAIGIGLLLVWYWFGREEPHIPPDESDFLPSGDVSNGLTESSTSFDLPDFRPFLKRIGQHFDAGFGDAVIDHVADLAARMRHDETRGLRYEVSHGGARVPFHIELFKDDVEEITAYFFTTSVVAGLIDAEMESFFAERGM